MMILKCNKTLTILLYCKAINNNKSLRTFTIAKVTFTYATKLRATAEFGSDSYCKGIVQDKVLLIYCFYKLIRKLHLSLTYYTISVTEI